MTQPWPTRWYLKRHALHGVVLVVELVETQRRGFMHYVTSRAHARKTLHGLRPLVEAIKARDFRTEPAPRVDTVFDVVEQDHA